MSKNIFGQSYIPDPLNHLSITTHLKIPLFLYTGNQIILPVIRDKIKCYDGVAISFKTPEFSTKSPIVEVSYILIIILTNQMTITIFLLQATLYIKIVKEVAGRVVEIERSAGKPFTFVNDFGQDLPDLGPDLGPDFVPQDEPAPPPEHLERENNPQPEVTQGADRYVHKLTT